MPYVYADDVAIRKYHDSRVLVQLTNDDDTIDYDNVVNMDEDVLMAMENAAAQEIDNHLRYVYDDLPLTGSNLTQEIVKICSHLTWCGLWQRRGEEPEQVTKLRESVLARLQAMSEPGAKEVRGKRSTVAYPKRSKKGKVMTVFDHSGYFDGLPSQGSRRLPADDE